MVTAPFLGEDGAEGTRCTVVTAGAGLALRAGEDDLAVRPTSPAVECAEEDWCTATEAWSLEAHGIERERVSVTVVTFRGVSGADGVRVTAVTTGVSQPDDQFDGTCDIPVATTTVDTGAMARTGEGGAVTWTRAAADGELVCTGRGVGIASAPPDSSRGPAEQGCLFKEACCSAKLARASP